MCRGADVITTSKRGENFKDFVVYLETGEEPSEGAQMQRLQCGAIFKDFVVHDEE